YYAPQTPLPQTAYQPHSQGMSMQWTGELRPWDGVWRGGPPPSTAAAAVRGRTSSQGEQWDRATSWERREERRREIEMGR
ncbi:hypothetical protein KC324_g9618, partial [Hortaea werneckii]